MSHHLQPAPLVFGNRQIATSKRKRYLNPGIGNNTAGLNPIGTSVFKCRRIRRMRLTVREGRGGTTVLTWGVEINGVVNDDLKIDKPADFTGTETLVLPIDKIVQVPADASLRVFVEKPATISKSPLDVSIALELI